MNIVEPFVRRPVATTLLTIGVALAGIVSFGLLPVSPLPQVDFPTVSVSASLPGASPEVMAATVATPLERALGRIAGVTEMTSSSSLGNARVTLQFELSRDINGAAREVQAAIQAARSQLPSSLPNNPTYRKVNPADAPVMILAMTSDTHSRGRMYDVASTVLAQRISQVPGVGQVTVGGGSLPAVRVELNPTVLNKLGVGFEDVRAAIAANNVNRPKGFLDDDQRYWQILANDQAKTAAEYMPIIVAYRNGAAVRLQDLGRVEDSVQDVRNFGVANGKPAVMLIINRQPNANIIEVVDRVTALLPEFRASIPQTVNLELMMERTSTIRASLREVERSLLISVALVILVVFLFLRSGRATLIPAIAVPVSLIGTFAAMHLLGYSLNNLSLMALTVATGFVVDDAIVVLENVQRYIEKGMAPCEAAMKGAREVAFTVVSISVSLVAVFIPILFMGGIIGRLFREFAVTLSVAIGISLLVSLTTTPMMCSLLLRRTRKEEQGRISRWAESAFDRVLRGYARSLAFVLEYPFPMLLILITTIGINVWLYTIVPKGFFPQQDTGRLIGFVRADQSISFQAMREKLNNFVAIVRKDPAVENVTAFTGGGQRNTAQMFISLKPLKEGREPIDTVLTRMRAALAKEPGANAFLNPIQDLRGGGRQSDAAQQFTLRGEDVSELRTWATRLERELRQLPEITDVNSDQQNRGLQMSLVIDRPTAARLGVSIRSIDSTLNLAFGQSVASTIYQDRNQYRVIMEAAPEYTQGPATLDSIHVLSPTKGQVPLSAFARYEPTLAPLSVNHQGQFAATTISFNLAPGVAMSEASQAIRDSLARIGAPTSIYASFEGTAKLFQQGLDNQPWLILAALLTVYIVLGILYESTIHPITILSTLPSAGVGALLALLLFKTEFSIIALIGVILLIGIVKKNAIMMIDFALAAERDHDASPRDAIFEACVLRFRPIMMTTMAALLGAVPLALGSGDGAELRRPLGISIVGGLILSQLLTLYTTPVVYLYLDRARHWTSSPGGNRRWHMRTRSLGSAVTSLFLASCAVGPNYERPAVETPAAYKEIPGNWVRAQPRDEAPRGQWWRIFNDPVLNDLAEQVSVSNQTLRAAEARYTQARAAVRSARSGLFPTLGASGGASRSRRGEAGASGSYDIGLDARWEIDLWGRVRRLVEASRAGEEASAADLESARLSLQSEVALNYFQLRVTDVQQALLEDTIKAFQTSFNVTQNRYKAGVAARVDVVQADSQLKSTQAQAVDLRATRATLEHAIAVLVGRPPAALSIEPTKLQVSIPDIPPGLPSTLLERRPDVAAAERRMAAANARIGVAQAAYFPSLSLSGSAGFAADALASLISAPSRVWSLGVGLAGTLLDFGARSANVDSARASYDEAVASYRQAVLEALQEVEDNLASVRWLAEEGDLQQDAARLARESVVLTVNQYKAGTVSYINVVQVQATQLNEERQTVQLLGRRLASTVRLIRALGGSWQD